jgi:hypothetical protein
MKQAMLVLVAALCISATNSQSIAKSYQYQTRQSYSSEHYYTNVSGHRVHSPVFSGSRPSGATAHCADGSWSFSEHARGTCSHHGGVSR